jgi:hypothetical protein
LADSTKQLYKQFPKRTVICTSKLQVHYASEITSFVVFL